MTLSFFNKSNTALPDRYLRQLKDHLNTFRNFEPSGYKQGYRYHIEGLQLLISGSPKKAIIKLKDAHDTYCKTDVSGWDTQFLLLKGNCILAGLIVSEVYESKYDVDAFNCDAVEAFSYFLLALELSNNSLLEPYASLSELLLLPCGMAITIACHIQTLPPRYFPQILSIVPEFWRSVYAGRAILSGNTESAEYISSHLTHSTARMEEIADIINNTGIFKNQLTPYDLLTVIDQSFPDDQHENYTSLYFDMIRNLKMGFAGKKISSLFEMLPMTLEKAILDENAQAIFSLVYTRPSNRDLIKSKNQIAEELIEIAKRVNQNSSYPIVEIIAKEALYFDPGNSEIQNYIW